MTITRNRMDIEKLVTWALRDQGLGWMGREVTREGFAELGTIIDTGAYGGRAPSVALCTDDDAHRVWLAIDALPRKAGALVTMYGRTGLRPPGADKGDPVAPQLRERNGRLAWHYAIPGNNRSAKLGPMLDVMALSRERTLVELDRARWTAWREALVALIGPLNNTLEGHFATGPEAPATPWVGKPVYVAPSELVDDGDEDEMARRGQGYSVADLTAEAQAPVRAVATDWSVPVRARRRRGPGRKDSDPVGKPEPARKGA